MACRAVTRPQLGGERAALGGDFELSWGLERDLDRLARAARIEPAARNALYAALAFKVRRFLAPYRARVTAVGDFEDLEQESFLVFVGLVSSWRGTGSFVRYFLGFFPWRLRHAIEAHQSRWPRERLVPWDAERASDIAAGADIACALLPPELGSLSAPEAELLRLHVMEDLPLTAIAPRFGWSRRTIFRRWAALRARLASMLSAPGVSVPAVVPDQCRPGNAAISLTHANSGPRLRTQSGSRGAVKLAGVGHRCPMWREAGPMRKQDLIKSVVAKVKLPAGQVEKVFDGIFDEIRDAMAKGEKVSLTGFGTFEVAERNERDVRNPRTGEKIRIGASKAPKFRAGSELKRATSGK